MENNEKALECYQEALNCCDNYYGADSNQSAYCSQLLGATYHQMGDTKKAIEYYQRSIDIFEQIYGPDNQDLQNLKQYVEKLKGE